jgi:hypothetical protein
MDSEQLIAMLFAEANKADDTQADLMRAAAEMLWEHPDTHAFKNFHSNLCKRFGYTHDERDWRRDLASLEEWIASRAGPTGHKLAAYKDAIADLTTESRYLRQVLAAAKALEARGFFAPSTCADDATADDMAAMRIAIADANWVAA